MTLKEPEHSMKLSPSVVDVHQDVLAIARIEGPFYVCISLIWILLLLLKAYKQESIVLEIDAM